MDYVPQTKDQTNRSIKRILHRRSVIKVSSDEITSGSQIEMNVSNNLAMIKEDESGSEKDSFKKKETNKEEGTDTPIVENTNFKMPEFKKSLTVLGKHMPNIKPLKLK